MLHMLDIAVNGNLNLQDLFKIYIFGQAGSPPRQQGTNLYTFYLGLLAALVT